MRGSKLVIRNESNRFLRSDAVLVPYCTRTQHNSANMKKGGGGAWGTLASDYSTLQYDKHRAIKGCRISLSVTRVQGRRQSLTFLQDSFLEARNNRIFQTWLLSAPINRERSHHAGKQAPPLLVQSLHLTVSYLSIITLKLMVSAIMRRFMRR